MAEPVTVVLSGGTLVTEAINGVPLIQTDRARPVTIAPGGPPVTFVNVGYSDDDWPSASNRPTFSGSTLTWVGPSGGGENDGSPVLQTRELVNSGAVNSSAPGQVIEGLNITGAVRIRHDNVILRQCRIREGEAVLVQQDSGTPTGVVIEDCLLDCTGIAGTTAYNPDGGGGGSIIRRCNITGCENGIGIGENDMLIEDNWIHDLAAGVVAHTDGIQGTGGYTALTIRHNAIYSFDTSCIIQQNEGAGFSGLVVDNNLLIMSTGSACIVCRGDKGVGTVGAVTFTDNHLGKPPGGFYNDFNTVAGPLTYTGNVDYLTLAPVNDGQ